MNPAQPAAHDLIKAGAIVLRPHAGGWRVLLLRAYRNWGFPKGVIESGETPLAAAIRETAEESSLDDLDFRWGEVFIDTPPRPGHQRTRYYLAVSPGARVFLPVSAELGRPEHHEFRWLAFDSARALLAPHLKRYVDWAQELAATSPQPAAGGTFASQRRSIS